MNPGCFGKNEEEHDKASEKPHCAIAKLTPYNVSKKKWNTKAQRSTKVCIALQLAKGTSQDEATSSSEEIKPIALSLHLAQGIS